MRDEDYFDRMKMRGVMGVAVLSVDPTARRVALSNGENLAYDHLLVASSARAVMPPIPGTNLQGIYTCITNIDAIQIAAAIPNVKDAVVIGMLVGCQDPVGDLLVGRPLNLARGRLAHAVGVHQHLDHHRRVVRRLPASIALVVGGDDRGQIERIHYIADEERHMIFGESVTQSWGQQEQLVGVVRFECFHAASIARTARVSSTHNVCRALFSPTGS